MWTPTANCKWQSLAKGLCLVMFYDTATTYKCLCLESTSITIGVDAAHRSCIVVHKDVTTLRLCCPPAHLPYTVVMSSCYLALYGCPASLLHCSLYVPPLILLWCSRKWAENKLATTGLQTGLPQLGLLRYMTCHPHPFTLSYDVVYS